MKKKDLNKGKSDDLTPQEAEEILVERISGLLVQKVLEEEKSEN